MIVNEKEWVNWSIKKNWSWTNRRSNELKIPFALFNNLKKKKKKTVDNEMSLRK